jgi:hypothetical protein
MAISRLYAVQLLAGQCQDFTAAVEWLEAGGAGLSYEQQEVSARPCTTLAALLPTALTPVAMSQQ